MKRTEHILYWEDVGERALYAQLDDYAWKLPEKVFGYEKGSSFYIYHDQKLAAYYHPADIEKEASIGFSFYANSRNVEEIIKLKRSVAEKVASYKKSIKNVSPESVTDRDLREHLIRTLDLYHEALSTHYLTQPQFFEEFEKKDTTHSRYKENLERLAHARLIYTRAAWIEAMALCKPFFTEYAERHGLTMEEAESMTYEELKSDAIDKKVLANRVDRYVLVSKHHDDSSVVVKPH